MRKIESIVDKYIQYSEAHRKFLQNGDHNRANLAYKSLTRLYQKMENDRSIAETALQTLLNYPSPAVNLWAASHAIGLNIQTEIAAKILAEIAQNDPKGLLGFSAEMTLKEWKRKGKLTF